MTSCREEIATRNHRTQLQKIWSSREWKEKKSEYLKGKACSICGRSERLLVHHPTDDLYARKYMDFTGCVPMCTSCHYALHKGFQLCPVCNKKFTKYEVCYDCLPDAEKEKHEVNKIMRRKLLRQLRKDAKEIHKKKYPKGYNSHT